VHPDYDGRDIFLAARHTCAGRHCMQPENGRREDKAIRQEAPGNAFTRSFQ